MKGAHTFSLSLSHTSGCDFAHFTRGQVISVTSPSPAERLRGARCNQNYANAMQIPKRRDVNPRHNIGGNWPATLSRYLSRLSSLSPQPVKLTVIRMPGNSSWRSPKEAGRFAPIPPFDICVFIKETKQVRAIFHSRYKFVIKRSKLPVSQKQKVTLNET